MLVIPIAYKTFVSVVHRSVTFRGIAELALGGYKQHSNIPISIIASAKKIKIAGCGNSQTKTLRRASLWINHIQRIA